jgi:arylsulfatase A-like enzyme
MGRWHGLSLLVYLTAAGAYGGWGGRDLWNGWGIWCFLLPPVIWAGAQTVGAWRVDASLPSIMIGLVMTALAVAVIGGTAVFLAWLIADTTLWSTRSAVRASVGGGLVAALGVAFWMGNTSKKSINNLGLILSLTAMGLAPRPAPAAPPNVVLILMDDLGWADVGCYGSTYYRTPNIDRLAAAGVRFTDAYAACPVCSPTRASILTGKYPARLHLTTFLPGRPNRPDQQLLQPTIRQHLPLEEITLAKALKAGGYATGHVGKWHLGGPGFLPTDQGFNVNVAGGSMGAPPTYFAPYKNGRGQFLPGLENAPTGEYLTDRLTAEAERFIEANKDRPFFLYFAHYAVHIPLMAKPNVLAKYPAGGKPGTQNNPIYAAMVESMDDSVGRVVKKLADLGLTERTVVIFTSDNGGLSVKEGPNTPATSNAPLRDGKGYLYEGGIREPFIIAGPGVTKPGAILSTPVISNDLFPTILELCGVKSDAKPDAVSIAPLLRGGSIGRDDLYWHFPHYSNQGGKPGGALRLGDLKLIEFYETGRHELYDLRRDIGEVRDLAGERPEVVKILATRLDAWRRSVDAQMMRPNPDYKPNPR